VIPAPACLTHNLHSVCTCQHMRASRWMDGWMEGGKARRGRSKGRRQRRSGRHAQAPHHHQEVLLERVLLISRIHHSAKPIARPQVSRPHDTLVPAQHPLHTPGPTTHARKRQILSWRGITTCGDLRPGLNVSPCSAWSKRFSMLGQFPQSVLKSHSPRATALDGMAAGGCGCLKHLGLKHLGLIPPPPPQALCSYHLHANPLQRH